MYATLEAILFLINNRRPFTEKDPVTWTIIYGDSKQHERQTFATEAEAREAALFATLKYPVMNIYSPEEVESLIKSKQEHDQNTFRTLDNDMK